MGDAAFDPNFIDTKSYALIGAKVVVKNSLGQALLLKRSQKCGLAGRWSLPGGKIERGEDPFDTAKREIAEETELQVKNLRPFTTLARGGNDHEDFIVIIGYVAESISVDVKLNWEHDEFVWVSLDEALDYILTDDARFILNKYRTVELVKV